MRVWFITFEICLLLVIFFGLLIWISQQVQSSPFEFESVENSPAKPIIAAMFSEYISERPGVKIYSAVVDLDYDGIGEIVVRFEHTESCFSDNISCRTVFLKYAPDVEHPRWQVKFDSFVNELDIFGDENSSSIHINTDNLVWKFDQARFWLESDRGSSELIMDPVPADSTEFIIGAFGAGAINFTNSENRDVKFSYAFVPTLEQSELLVLSANGAGICGSYIGCPLRIIRKVNDKWDVVLKAAAENSIKVRSFHRQGIPDFSLATPNGIAIFGWTGTQFDLINKY